MPPLSVKAEMFPNFYKPGFTILILFFGLCFELNAKSVLLKNGKKLENVGVKPVSNGFEVSHPDGRIEKISLSEVLKIFISDRVPKKDTIQTKPILTKKEEAAPSEPKETISSEDPPKKKSGVAVFAEGLIPGWSRMARSDSYAVKGLGFLFICTELYLAHKTYQITRPPGPASDSSHPLISPYVLAAFALRDNNLLFVAYANSIISEQNQVRLSDGRVIQKGRYEQEREAYISAFLFVLLMDAFLGYRFEDWTVVPKVNVSVQSREISAGVTIRF
ncbi:LA_0442/LA_0875 N-terminal domain-containing protein [Leptospira adleri]|uniref:LA_0442/LA_0875 N-terminal domain-containing protein n=1 Tax=Leptospira adleri TaxID=2023186 RepID=UPI001082A0CD|nr:DNA-binding protein [Leptospira adleri]TGM52735.1 DNA-binding protein [Leptospira adleri]